MTVQDLKPGDEFKWKPRQAEFRTVKEIIPVPYTPSMPDHYEGALIIVLSNCRTLTIQPREEVIIKTIK